WPYYGPKEIKAAIKVLRSGKANQWTGTEVTCFEKEYARYLGVNYCVAMANGSVALDTALAVLGIGKGDQVIVPSRTFVASASCVGLRGAIPVFADVDPETGNITADTIKKVYTRRTKAVIVVHLAGWPCAMDEIRDFCHEKKIYLIEDCAQAHGARYRGKPVGSFGDIACFSFCQDKIMTTAGEGGLLATSNKKLWQAAWSLKDHGRNYDKAFGRKQGVNFAWIVDSFGTNYRMIEIQAAIGRIMLKKLDGWVVKRRQLAQILNDNFSKMPALRTTIPPKEVYHSYYKFYVHVRPEKLKTGWSRDRILKELASKGIVCGCGACPELYLEKAFKDYRRGSGLSVQKRLPIAKKLGETSMMFQVHPTLSEKDMCYIVDEMRKVLKKAEK
ncbi:MAG: DegT/DnrJ/EryC1/StrS aminotransferase family protein, partial [Candidatus Omnitrophica bacterium]|nr:DegT/DnrJ/EryC1/StrS aminotransferase family protein [Candidatus Omnitrophota bacterium]